MRRIGNQLLSESRSAGKLADKDRKSQHARDILSILVSANTMEDLPVLITLITLNILLVIDLIVYFNDLRNCRRNLA